MRPERTDLECCRNMHCAVTIQTLETQQTTLHSRPLEGLPAQYFFWGTQVFRDTRICGFPYALSQLAHSFFLHARAIVGVSGPVL